VDYRRLAQVDFLQVGIGKSFRQVVYTFPRPDLPDFLGLSGSLNPELLLGWECVFDDADLTPGCQDIQLSIGNTSSDRIMINTRIQLCVR
jgi:hypothetical protein